jgi:hypothetical protein
MDTEEIWIDDEDSLQEVFDEMAEELPPEAELNFSTDESDGEGHIYESIEDEVGEAADAAAVEDIPPDEFVYIDHEGLPTDFEDVLPESFYEGLTGG